MLKMSSARQQQSQSSVVRQIELTERAVAAREVGGALRYHACIGAGARQDGHECELTKQFGLTAQASLGLQHAALTVLQFEEPRKATCAFMLA